MPTKCRTHSVRGLDSALTAFVVWDTVTSKIALGAGARQRDQDPLALVVSEISGIGSLGGGGQGGGSGAQGDDGEDELHVGSWLGKLELVGLGVGVEVVGSLNEELMDWMMREKHGIVEYDALLIPFFLPPLRIERQPLVEMAISMVPSAADSAN